VIIDCIADLHGHYPKLEGGDLLIVAGDLTATDNNNEWIECDDWLRSQKYKYIKVVVIAGNHDGYLYDGYDNPFHLPFSDYEADSRDKIPFVDYLCDSGTEFEGLKIWGSPWTVRFEGMNPHCMAFTVDTEEELTEKWAKIPDDVDILITHSPPKYGLDKTIDNDHVGSKSLKDWVLTHQPRLHVFGHIHESYGLISYEDIQKLNIQLFGNLDNRLSHTTIINASHVNEHYEPVNKPIRIEL
jgi:Icc-related predicted phosphoesterase